MDGEQGEGVYLPTITAGHFVTAGIGTSRSNLGGFTTDEKVGFSV
jgi:hypothetical protein